MTSDGDDLAERPALTHSPTLKRRRADSTASSIIAQNVTTQAAHDRASSDGSDGASTSSVLEIDEDLLEDMAAQAAISAKGLDLPHFRPADVRARIREVGLDQFFGEFLLSSGLSAKDLGSAFGIQLDDFQDPDDCMTLLTRIVVRYLTKRQKLSKHNTIDDAATLLRESRNILVITGAGISTSLGIPDFRSKHTGFYSKLQDLGFSEPEDVFDIYTFDDDPTIFYSLAGDILPHGKDFTPTHAFIRLLQDHGRLQTNYTQNIDNVEANAGIDRAKVIQCHGSFATASCRKCKHQIPGDEVFDDIRAKRVAYCTRCISRIAEESERPAKKQIKRTHFARDDLDDDSDIDDTIPTPGVMKPDITFFGEQLSDVFYDRFINVDSHQADLVVVIGTSLKVAPVGDMPDHMPENVPHIFISREACEHINFDIQLLGDCDTVVWELCKRAGWDLSHKMIPADMSTTVAAVEGSTHRWSVAKAEQTSPNTTNGT